MRRRDLLKNSENTAAEIGVKLGYAGRAHFTRVFKSRTGMMPFDFRAKTS
ncbi:MAG: helix-turn-helix domain-containing protein [Marinibacterium sp.]|nr:helix-turn-helix domain-containing protein [Marinibacterium sp.]